ncbi:MAG: LacI family transcriptional regulator [Bacteroidales bacterium]|nr:LacI family transcriptional regulator [Bacteroidales bacterium]
MKETLKSIAERLGVSPTTVSRVLSGNASKYRISPKTARIVLAEAQRVDYLPEFKAQYLRNKKNKTVGLIIPSIANQFFADIASIVIGESRRRGFTTIVIDSMEDEASQTEGLKTLVSRGVDGIIVAPCVSDRSGLEKIDRDFCPVVLVDRYFARTTLSYVTTNNYEGGAQATRYLISQGHKKIACIQGPPTLSPIMMRVNGYLDEMKAAGLEDESIVVGDVISVQEGYVETKLLLSLETRPTAIFALSNTIALGTIKAIREAGLSIPDDISVVSFDDSKFLDYFTPAISRISQPTEDMATLATKILFESIELRGGAAEGRDGEASPARGLGAASVHRGSTHLQLSPTLLIRDSVKKI